MAMFEYNGLTSSGRLMKGTIEAACIEEAEQTIRQMRLTLNKLTKAKEKTVSTAIGRNEFLLFNQQLASITKAGVPLERALKELSGDVSSRSMRKLINQIADELQAGVSIESALEKRQRLFPPLYGRIISAGVRSGRLGDMLTSLNRHIETGIKTRRIIFEAMTYPLVTLALASVIITAVFLIVMPPVAALYSDLTENQGRLPYLTIWFLTAARYVKTFWTAVLSIIAAMVFLWIALGKSSSGRRFRESIFLKIPLISDIYRRGTLARMADAMAVLVSAGCTMPQCLRLGGESCGSEKARLECEILAQSLEQGSGIMDAAAVCRFIPRLFLYSVQLGSQRNELQDNLYSLGQLYAEQTRGLQARLQTMLMPVMIVVVGGFIALMVLSIFLPMIKVITAMG